MNLFEVEPKEKGKPANRCRGCVHMVTHEWNKGFKYCAKQRSKKTSNGLKKIKANDAACPMFESKKNKP